jgi:hypothetical protein
MGQQGSLFFVVRTDIDASSGVNRCFATCDTEVDARLVMSQLQSSIQGEFAVYQGGAEPAAAEDPQVAA